jgi:hypothetical protein
MTRDISVGIATGYELDDWMIGVRFPAWAGKFSLHHHVQTVSGAHPTSYPMSTWAFSLGVKWPGRKADYSPPSSAEAKNAWSYASTPQYVFMVWCSVKAQGQLYILHIHENKKCYVPAIIAVNDIFVINKIM